MSQDEPYFVDAEARHGAQIVATFALAHNVRYFRLRVDGRRVGQPLGLPAGRHLRIHANVFDAETGAAVAESRSYTPIADADAHHDGDAEFAIKIYSLVDEKSHSLGVFSRHLAALKIGDRVEVSGPRGKIFYAGGGRFERASGERAAYRRVGLVAGGAGITPIIRMIRAFVAELDAAAASGGAAATPLDQFSLLYTNHREEDILFRTELEEYARNYPANFRLLFTLTEGEFASAAAADDSAVDAASAAYAENWRSIVPARVGWTQPKQQQHQQQQTNSAATADSAADAASPAAAAVGQQRSEGSAAIRTTGRINEQMLRQILPPLTSAKCKLAESDECKLSDEVNDETLILIRGRKAMKKMAEELCAKIGYKNIR